MTTVKNFCINLTSAEGQANTASEVKLLVSKVVDQIEYIRPMIQCKRAILWRMVESDPSPKLQREKALDTSISEIDDRDIRIRWQTFQKKYMSDAEKNVLLQFEMNAIPRLACVSDQCTHNSIWISFENSNFSLVEFKAVSDTNTEYQIRNSSDISVLVGYLPVFKHSPKHQAHPYFDKARSEQVAAMPIRCENEAGILLRNGISEGRDYFSKNKDGNYFRFKNTIRNEYHGFEIDKDEIPRQIKNILDE